MYAIFYTSSADDEHVVVSSAGETQPFSSAIFDLNHTDLNATNLSLCAIKCCYVTLRLIVINISSPAIKKLRCLLPAISVTTCHGPAAPC